MSNHERRSKTEIPNLELQSHRPHSEVARTRFSGFKVRISFGFLSDFVIRHLLRSTAGQVAEFQIPEPDLAAVFLQEKMAFGAFAKAADVFELAIGNGGFDFVA